MKTAFIYILKDPTDLRARYVGLTYRFNDIKDLHPSHWAHQGSKELKAWLKSIGNKPVIQLIVKAPKNSADVTRKLVIRSYINMGYALYNSKKSKRPTTMKSLWTSKEFRDKVKKGRARAHKAVTDKQAQQLKRIKPISSSQA